MADPKRPHLTPPLTHTTPPLHFHTEAHRDATDVDDMKSGPFAYKWDPAPDTSFPPQSHTEPFFMPASPTWDFSSYLSTQLGLNLPPRPVPLSLPTEGALHHPHLPTSPPSCLSHYPALRSKTLGHYSTPKNMGLLGIKPASLPLTPGLAVPQGQEQ